MLTRVAFREVHEFGLHGFGEGHELEPTCAIAGLHTECGRRKRLAGLRHPLFGRFKEDAGSPTKILCDSPRRC
jgi:hypothetical protein